MSKIPFRIKPMLAALAREPFNAAGWVYEGKYDGDRILAYKEGKDVQLLTRNGIDRRRGFLDIAAAVAGLRPKTLLLDGEVVIFDRKGASRFQLLQQGKGTPIFAIFDCLYRNGKDLRSEPLSARREALEETIDSAGVLLLARRLEKDGLKAFRTASRRGYEGLVAKKLSSAYRPGRSSDWLKVKVRKEDEFVIVGFTKPGGARKHFGALLLGAYDGVDLRYVGKVGTGFNEQTLRSLYEKFRPLVKKKPALAEPIRERDAVFLTPRLVAQVTYQEWTSDGKLRQPVYLGLRDDKAPEEVRIPETQ